MNFIDEHTLLIFFAQVFILLLFARGLGEIFSRLKLPEVAGEILAGLLLGGLIFGKITPELHGQLFPKTKSIFYMLETLSWFGVLFLLLIAGLEIDLSNVVRHQKSLFFASVSTLGIPLVIGFIWAILFAKQIVPEGTPQWVFAVFIGLTSGIAAVPVIAKILHDMDLLKTDVGFLSLSIATVGDLIGWTFFTVLLGVVAEEQVRLFPAFRILFFTILFLMVSLTVGRTIVNFLVKKIAQSNLPKTKSMLTFVFLLSLFMGTLTQWIGIHGLFGFFIAGILLGESSYLDENARETIKQVIFSFFAPIFFANIGLKIQLSHGLNVSLVLILLMIAMGGKFVGGYLGTRMGGLSGKDALMAGAAVSPGGAMEIVLALLALEYKLINMDIFVAIVLMAIFSSLFAGPLLAWFAKKGEIISIARFFRKDLFIVNCEEEDKVAVLGAISKKIAEIIPDLEYEMLYKEALRREELLSTGMERGLALPHVRMNGLKEPLIAYAYHSRGVDWNSLDGIPAQHIFFIVTPQDDPGFQTMIISRLAGLWRDRQFIQKLEQVKNFDQFLELFNQYLKKLEESLKLKQITVQKNKE